MTSKSPGVLSVRAVNQYRRRDVLTYLGLRYYLHNAAARPDHWARQAATDLVLTRSTIPYFRAVHYKETNARGEVEHRPMYLPGANEALAEAALLDECSKHPLAFSNPATVFSYGLCTDGDTSGVFRHYIGGLRDRHQAVAEACDACPEGIVRYVDIRRFYSSIRLDAANKVWQQQCEVAGLPSLWRALGERLIAEHGRAGNSGEEDSILTGPMFSHLLGNLILRSLDNKFTNNSGGARYYRYVDDITLVGAKSTVAKTLEELHACLADLGFMLHDDSSPKSIEVSAKEWIKGRDDFKENWKEVSWATLIGDLKQFLITKPTERESLKAAFRSEGFRIPVRDYTGAIHERTFLERIVHFARRPWFRRKARAVSIVSLLGQARWLRKTYDEELRSLADGAEGLAGFERKRRVPKLRYRAGRLVYLAKEETLGLLSSVIRALPELKFHESVMNAVAFGRIDGVLSLGTNAAQAAAQPLRAAGMRCTASAQSFSEIEIQGLAVLKLNGVKVDCHSSLTPDKSELTRFAASGVDRALMKSTDPFIREIACLHGISDQPRHPALLESVFDEDEELTLDAIDQIQQSYTP